MAEEKGRVASRTLQTAYDTKQQIAAKVSAHKTPTNASDIMKFEQATIPPKEISI